MTCLPPSLNTCYLPEQVLRKNGIRLFTSQNGFVSFSQISQLNFPNNIAFQPKSLMFDDRLNRWSPNLIFKGLWGDLQFLG